MIHADAYLKGPGRKLGNPENHGIPGNSSQTRELQIIPILIKKN